MLICVFCAGLLFTSYHCASARNCDTACRAIKSIYWSDGGSGRITFDNGEIIPFRINDRDATETGGVGAAIGEPNAKRNASWALRRRNGLSDLRGALNWRSSPPSESLLSPLHASAAITTPPLQFHCWQIIRINSF